MSSFTRFINSKNIKPYLEDFYKYIGPTAKYDLLNKLYTLPSYTELPTHIGKAVLSNFKGPKGTVNLRNGMDLGSGLAAMSLGADSVASDDLHGGRAATLGALGLMAPALYRGGRAGAFTAKKFHNMVQNLANAGISAIGKKDRAIREKFLGDVFTSPIKTVSEIFKGKRKKDINSILRPSNTVTMDYLNNSAGSMNSLKNQLRTAVGFGRTAVDSGVIQNPSAARAAHSVAQHKFLKDIGFHKLYGTSGTVTEMGKDLADILQKRYQQVMKKLTPEELQQVLNGRKFSDLSAEELKKLMPSSNARIFPFSTEVPGIGKITLKEYDVPRRGPHAGGTSRTSAVYPNLPNDVKKWLWDQGIRDSKSYQAMANHMSYLPVAYGKKNAEINPEAWLTSAVQNFRHYYAPGKSWWPGQARRFSYDLTGDLAERAPKIRPPTIPNPYATL
jgi:hypothetical protein